MNATWFKSSFSFSNGNCVQVASWRKASGSVGNGACVQAGHGPGVVGVRDSALGAVSLLVVPVAAWSAFTASLK